MAFLRGARPTPHHKLLAAPRHRVVTAPPPQFSPFKGKVKLSVWDNDVDGVCVSSEEAAAKATYSVFCGLAEVFATDAEVRTFAARHGWLNGADLSEVMDAMIREGMPIGGTAYKDGPYSAVNYSDETELQSAIALGPVKIAIDADALPSGAGNGSGWWTTAAGRYRNTDHCVGLYLYGTAAFIFQALCDAGLIDSPTVPAGLDPNTKGYGLFTWGTIGFVTHEWIMGTCTEAWVRNPTTVGESPAPTPPPVPPAPPKPDTVTIPDRPVTVAGIHVPGMYAAGGTFAVDRDKAIVGFSFDIVPALLQLSADVAKAAPGLWPDVLGVWAAVRARSGILTALEMMARDVIDLGGNPAVLADLLRIAADLGVPVPAGSPLRG